MMLALPIFRLPAPEYREAMAADREAAAWHEAGHAVAAVAAGLPVHRSRVAYKGRRTFRAEHWCVTARTDITFAGGAFRRTTHDDLVAVMAGAEAEALFLRDARGMSTAAARAEARDGNDGDEHQALRFAKGSAEAVQEAADEAAILVRLRRPAIEAVAAMLTAHGTASGAQVRAAVTETLPPADDDLDEWLRAIDAVAGSCRRAGITTEAVLDAGQAAVDRVNARRGR